MVLEGQSFKQYSLPLLFLSLIAALLSAVGALGTDIYLASTQWLLVAIFLAVLAVFAKLE